MKSKYKYTVNTSLIHDIKNLNIQRIVRNLLVKITFASVTIWRRTWQPTPALLPGKSHGRRGLVGYSPWGCEESDTTERLHFPFSLSCIGEGNGNPLQCSCLENLRDRGACWVLSMGSHRVGHD